MMTNFQLLTIDSDGCRGHRAWLSGDDSEYAIGRIIDSQWYCTAYELQNTTTGECIYIMGPRRTREFPNGH